MKRVALADVELPASISPADVVRPLSGPLGTTDVAVAYFELASGETFGFDYHRHADQEELFYVQPGTATYRIEDGDVEVGAGEVIRIAPGSSSSAGTG